MLLYSYPCNILSYGSKLMTYYNPLTIIMELSISRNQSIIIFLSAFHILVRFLYARDYGFAHSSNHSLPTHNRVPLIVTQLQLAVCIDGLCLHLPSSPALQVK